MEARESRKGGKPRLKYSAVFGSLVPQKISTRVLFERNSNTICNTTVIGICGTAVPG
jgi:hypothetical protein